MLSPFKYHSNVIGRSPSLAEQVTSTKCPSCTGLSSKEKGVMRGKTIKLWEDIRFGLEIT